jgi:hypothetical protein
LYERIIGSRDVYLVAQLALDHRHRHHASCMHLEAPLGPQSSAPDRRLNISFAYDKTHGSAMREMGTVERWSRTRGNERERDQQPAGRLVRNVKIVNKPKFLGQAHAYIPRSTYAVAVGCVSETST